MKGPSIDAIRRFKEQQEQKKQEQDERKIQDKISTLAHRASQGDRKAKIELRKIEKIKEEANREPQPQEKQIFARNSTPSQSTKPSQNDSKKAATAPAKRIQKVETDFDELMKLAKNNSNEIKKPPPPPPPPPKPVLQKVKRKQEVKERPAVVKVEVQKARVPQPMPSQMKLQAKPQAKPVQPRETKPPADSRMSLDQRIQAHKRREAFLQTARGRHMFDRAEEDDEYESDGFVVNEDDDDVQDELRKTLKTVFRYDRRRCDLREEELDRQYRAIGRVSTFEDLEREERRAAKLAAAEDAEAHRQEEERKRKKKLRLQKS